jgi:hypothetical protein
VCLFIDVQFSVFPSHAVISTIPRLQIPLEYKLLTHLPHFSSILFCVEGVFIGLHCFHLVV